MSVPAYFSWSSAFDLDKYYDSKGYDQALQNKLSIDEYSTFNVDAMASRSAEEKRLMNILSNEVKDRIQSMSETLKEAFTKHFPNISSFLNYDDVLRLRLVCRDFHRAAHVNYKDPHLEVDRLRLICPNIPSIHFLNRASVKEEFITSISITNPCSTSTLFDLVSIFPLAPRVESIELQHVHGSDVAWKALFEALPLAENLNRLVIRDCEMSLSSYESLVSAISCDYAPILKSFVFSRCQPYASIEHMLPNLINGICKTQQDTLEYIDLSFLPIRSQSASALLKPLLKSCTQLRAISLRGWEFDETAVELLANFGLSSRLDGDTDIEHTQSVFGRYGLETLSVSLSNFNDQFLQHLAPALGVGGTLKLLDLRACAAISATGIMQHVVQPLLAAEMKQNHARGVERILLDSTACNESSISIINHALRLRRDLARSGVPSQTLKLHESMLKDNSQFFDAASSSPFPLPSRLQMLAPTIESKFLTSHAASIAHSSSLIKSASNIPSGPLNSAVVNSSTPAVAPPTSRLTAPAVAVGHTLASPPKPLAAVPAPPATGAGLRPASHGATTLTPQMLLVQQHQQAASQQSAVAVQQQPSPPVVAFHHPAVALQQAAAINPALTYLIHQQQQQQQNLQQQQQRMAATGVAPGPNSMFQNAAAAAAAAGARWVQQQPPWSQGGYPNQPR